MGIYKFSASVTHEIQSTIAQSFWGQKRDRTERYIGTQCVNQSVLAGGMGFKDILVFTDALFGWQAWRLFHGYDILVGKVMNYPITSLLEASLGTSTSYSWNGVQNMKSLVKEERFGEMLMV